MAVVMSCPWVHFRELGSGFASAQHIAYSCSPAYLISYGKRVLLTGLAYIGRSCSTRLAPEQRRSSCRARWFARNRDEPKSPRGRAGKSRPLFSTSPTRSSRAPSLGFALGCIATRPLVT